MKIKTTLLLTLGSAILLAGCQYTGPSATTTAPTTAPTAAVSPSKSANVNDLNADLDTTVDDGGQADLKALEKEAAGL